MAVEAVVAVVLAAALARAAFGAPPAGPDPVAATCWLVAGLLLLCLVALDSGGALGLAFNAIAVIALAVAGWWMRGGRDDGDGGEDPGEPPVDWDEFDRLRGQWDRPTALS